MRNSRDPIFWGAGCQHYATEPVIIVGLMPPTLGARFIASIFLLIIPAIYFSRRSNSGGGKHHTSTDIDSKSRANMLLV
jgi:hypothetical protein